MEVRWGEGKRLRGCAEQVCVLRWGGGRGEARALCEEGVWAHVRRGVGCGVYAW